MKNIILFILPVALVLALGAPASAQPIKYAQAGMPFLQISVGARTAALGSTQQGLIGDASAMFGNPAGLAMVDRLDAFSTVTSWIADIKHYGLGAAYQIGQVGTIGLGFVWMDYGNFVTTLPANDSDPISDQNRGYVEGDPFTVNEYAMNVSFARQITDQFAVGGNLRYAVQELPSVLIEDELHGQRVADNKINLIVLDFGTLYYPGFEDLRFGMSVRNFSNQADYFDQRFELPLTFDFGVAMNMLSLMPASPEHSTLTLAVDWLHPRDFSERLHLGLEYGFQNIVFVRGGYKFNYDEEGFSGGLGVRLATGGYGLKADYAYSAFGDFFGTVHRVTLGILLE